MAWHIYAFTWSKSNKIMHNSGRQPFLADISTFLHTFLKFAPLRKHDHYVRNLCGTKSRIFDRPYAIIIQIIIIPRLTSIINFRLIFNTMLHLVYKTEVKSCACDSSLSKDWLTKHQQLLLLLLLSVSLFGWPSVIMSNFETSKHITSSRNSANFHSKANLLVSSTSNVFIIQAIKSVPAKKIQRLTKNTMEIQWNPHDAFNANHNRIKKNCIHYGEPWISTLTHHATRAAIGLVSTQIKCRQPIV